MTNETMTNEISAPINSNQTIAVRFADGAEWKQSRLRKRMHRFAPTILFFAVLISGCANNSITNIKREVSIAEIDFRKYSDAGFLMTPFMYQGKYESIGVVTATIFPSAKYYGLTTTGTETGTPIGGSWQIQRVFANDVIDSLYRLYSSRGANAIVSLKISPATKTYNPGTLESVELYGVTVDGFAIKRNDP